MLCLTTIILANVGCRLLSVLLLLEAFRLELLRLEILQELSTI